MSFFLFCEKISGIGLGIELSIGLGIGLSIGLGFKLGIGLGIMLGKGLGKEFGKGLGIGLGKRYTVYHIDSGFFQFGLNHEVGETFRLNMD